MENNILEAIMDVSCCVALTICGSAKNRELKERYQAYYTLKNDFVFMPVNYLLIKNEVETSEEIIQHNIVSLHHIHDKKIRMSDAIIVVTADDGYFGSDTAREINIAHTFGKIVLFTHIKEEDKDKYYFNNDQTYPLYILKEEYQWH